MPEPEPVESTDARDLRPPDVFIATPPLATCLARSVYGPPGPTSGDGDLELFQHLVPVTLPGHTDAPTAREMELVRTDAARLRRLVGDAAYASRLGSATVVYRLESGDHCQTGVLVECPVADYRRGRVRRHEATSASRVRQLADFLSAAESELVPVTLVHPPRPGLRSLLAEAAAGEPHAVLQSGDDLRESVWVVDSPALTRRIWAELRAVDALYIADGHHRMDAAEQHARDGPGGSGMHATDHVLCALFPGDEARVLGYHRCVTAAGVSTHRVLEAVARHPRTDSLEECGDAEDARTARGVLVLFVDGRWFRLSLRSPAGGDDPRAGLDIVVLENEIIPAAVQAGEASPDAEITALPGNIGRTAFARWCEQHHGIGFLVAPPSIEQVMAVADAGAVMPAKSTWFDPKARAGLFVRDLSATGTR